MKEYLENCTYKFPSKRGIFRSQRSRIRQIFYFVIPHPSPSSRVASYFVNCIDAFSLYSLAEEERETEDFACSAYRTASFRVLHIPQTNQRLSSSFLCNRWWTDGISFNEIFSFARLIYFPVNRMSIVFSLPLLNFRDRNCIVVYHYFIDDRSILTNSAGTRELLLYNYSFRRLNSLKISWIHLIAYVWIF